MDSNNRLPLTLFLLRVSVFIVMFVWTIDKFIRPKHASTVYEHFYFLGGLPDSFFYLIGTLELVILIGFVLGFQKEWTYGLVLLFHGISTLTSFQQYMKPFESVNLLFFAAWPMLAACFALWYMRDLDTCWVVDKIKDPERSG